MVEAADLTLNLLDAIYPNRQLSNTKSLQQRDIAVRYVNNIFGDRVSTLAEVEGDEEDFAHYVWAAFIEDREGEPTSESQSGGSVNYNRAQDKAPGLPMNRFGQMARGMLREQQSVGVVKGQAHFID
jgi:hypothetical protein